MSSELPQAPPPRASRLRRQRHDHRRRSIELLVAVLVVTLGVGYAYTQINEGDLAGAGDDGSPSPAQEGSRVARVRGHGGAQAAPCRDRNGGEPSGGDGVPAGPHRWRCRVRGSSRPGRSRRYRVPVCRWRSPTWWGPGPSTTRSPICITSCRWSIATTVLRVQLTDPVTIDDEVLGPGAVTMTGAQVAEFLGAEGQNTYTRWEIVLTAFLATPPAIEASDLTETDDLAGVQATFDGAEGRSPGDAPRQGGRGHDPRPRLRRRWTRSWPTASA